jgi:hypothetical protein
MSFELRRCGSARFSSYHGRAVVLLGLEPMSVPDRHAQVRDVETDEELDVPVADLVEAEGLPPPA